MLSLLPTLPTSAEIVSSTGAYTATVFTDLVPLVLLGVGIVAGAMFLKFIAGKVMGGIKTVAGRRGRRRGRR